MEKKLYSIRTTKKADKGLAKMPKDQQRKFHTLALYLRENGPIAKDWPNYSKLGKNEYHCHLSHNWVACWKHEKGSIIIEVYYAGSRGNAPY